MYSRKIWFLTALGFWLGMSVHIAYSFLGLALIISHSLLVFNLIKYLGVFYLLYIAYKSFSSWKTELSFEENKKKKMITNFEAAKMGFLTNLLNPKVSLFFLSLFTFVVSPDIPKTFMFFLAFFMVLNTILWFSFLSFLITRKKVHKFYSKYQNKIQKTFWAFLAWFALKLALIQK